MSVYKYISRESIEDLVEHVVVKFLFPALEKVVSASDNTYDDAALAVAKPLILKAIDKIDGKQG